MNTDKALGSLFSIPDLRDYIAKTNKTDFPETFQLELPYVKNQGSVGSCVAHAITTVAEYFNQQEEGKYLKLSTGYIYGNRLLSTHKGSGMYTRDALKTMTKFGVVPFEKFPYNIEVPEAISTFEQYQSSIEEDGLKYKFASYFILEDNNAIKTQLLNGRPVVMAMWWYDDIDIVDGVMITDCVKTKKTGGHCMVIYGWQENGWLVQNSWGTKWGNGGKFVLPYNIPLKETWGVSDAEENSDLVIEKPFKTRFGALVAKIIHNILTIFYNMRRT